MRIFPRLHIKTAQLQPVGEALDIGPGDVLERGHDLPALTGGRGITRASPAFDPVHHIPVAIDGRAGRDGFGLPPEPASLVLPAGEPGQLGSLEHQCAGRRDRAEGRGRQRVQPGGALQWTGPPRGVRNLFGLPGLCARAEQQQVAEILAEPGAFVGRQQCDRGARRPGRVVEGAIVREDAAAEGRPFLDLPRRPVARAEQEIGLAHLGREPMGEIRRLQPRQVALAAEEAGRDDREEAGRD